MTDQTPPTDRPLTAGDCYDEHQPGCDCVIAQQTASETPSYLDRLSRPATSAASEGALAALICAILEDEGGSGAPWSVIADRIAASIIDENHLAVSSWTVRAALERIAGEQQYRSGYCQTDITVEPALSADEAQSLARETLAALASPPVSERERELEGALREDAVSLLRHVHDRLVDDDKFDTLRLSINSAIRTYLAITVQPAGEGK